MVSTDGESLPLELTIRSLKVDGQDLCLVIARSIAKRIASRQKRREIERLVRIISENAQDVITYSILGNPPLYVSSAIQTVLGYSPDDIVSGRVTLTYHPDDGDVMGVCRDRVEAGETSFVLTARVKHANGRWVWMETVYRVVPADNPNECAIVGIGRDVSDRKKMQRRFEHAQRIAKVGHWERDFEENWIYWSDEVFRIFGLEPSQPLSPEDIFEMTHPQDRAKVVEAFAEAEAGEGYSLDYRIVRPDGEVRYVHSQGEHIWRDGRIVGMFGSVQDITDRKLIEEDLTRSKESLKLAHRIAGLGYWDLQIQTNEFYCSPNLSQIWGLGEKTFPDARQAILANVHPDDAAYVEAAMDQIMNNQPSDVEFRIIRPDGSVRNLRGVSEIIVDSDGVPIRRFGVVQDNTDQKRAEELLIHSEMLSAIGQLAAGLAHEIRNPLTAIKGFAKLLANDDNHPYEQIIRSELERIESIVNELLVLAKPQAVAYKPCGIPEVLQDVVDFLDAEAIMHNVTLQFDVSGEIPHVHAEPNQLKQVFINMIQNAMEAMTDGGTVHIAVRRQHNSVVICFEDTGVGIAPDILQALGQPFVTTKPDGVGLGFMISKKIVQDHRGTMNVHSEVGVGTTIEIALPVA